MRAPALPAPMREQAERRLDVARRAGELHDAWEAWLATAPDPAEVERARMEVGRLLADKVRAP